MKKNLGMKILSIGLAISMMMTSFVYASEKEPIPGYSAEILEERLSRLIDKKLEIPVYSAEEFFGTPGSLAFSLRGGEGKLLFVESVDNIFNLFEKDMETGEVTQITNITDRNMANYFVKGDVVLYIKDFEGDENYHIFKTDEDGNEVDLTPYENTRVMVLDTLNETNLEHEILIQMNLDNKEVFSVYRLNVVDGSIEKVLDNEVGYSGFLTDNDGKIRIATFTDGVNYGYFYRETEKDEFELVQMYGFEEAMVVLMFAEDNKTGYGVSNIGRDKTALVKVDVATGEELEVLYENEHVDVNSSISRGREVGTLGAITYITDRTNVEYFDEEFEKVHKEIEALVGENEQFGYSFPRNEFDRAIVTVSSDVTRGRIYYFDREKGTMEQLSDMNFIDSEHLAEMTPISYEARDGVLIHGYLTLPKNVEAKNLPVIVNPHGGPWSRDVWGYNPEVQFLANRGYAVLQMDFRGSTGYGREFLEAGYKQWGLDMQNDITDGVKWLIEQGIADPDRIGIYGASYGGYATLAGVTFTPELYAAAVNYVGVSNLFTFLETIPEYWESMRAMLYEMIGHPEEDAEQFKATSPVFHADKIVTPLLIAHGANDVRVNQAEADQIVEALKNNGVEVEYILKEDEGHGFARFENQIEFYNAMEKFFAEHLGGKYYEYEE